MLPSVAMPRGLHREHFLCYGGVFLAPQLHFVFTGRTLSILLKWYPQVMLFYDCHF